MAIDFPAKIFSDKYKIWILLWKWHVKSESGGFEMIWMLLLLRQPIFPPIFQIAPISRNFFFFLAKNEMPSLHCRVLLDASNHNHLLLLLCHQHAKGFSTNCICPVFSSNNFIIKSPNTRCFYEGIYVFAPFLLYYFFYWWTYLRIFSKTNGEITTKLSHMCTPQKKIESRNASLEDGVGHNIGHYDISAKNLKVGLMSCTIFLNWLYI